MHVNQLSKHAERYEISIECETQINNIIRIIRESLEKLKISLILPQIFENFSRIRQYLSGFEYEECITLIEEYIKEKKLDNAPFQAHLNYRLIKIIDFFHENFKTLEYFSDWLNNLKTSDKSLIESFQLLQNISEQRLKKSAIYELKKEREIHEIFHENENIKKNIEVLQHLLKSQHINLKWKLAAKEGIIQKYEKDLATLKYENNIKIKEKVVKSSQNIQQIHAFSVVKQKELEEELARIKIEYEHLLRDNLKQQKNARDEKNKLLFQLQSLIKKYDQTMGDKIKENMFLQDEYERQKQQFDVFMIEYNRQEGEYDCIVRSKKEEEKQHHQQKILFFMMNRSARVVQKYWRRYKRIQKKASKKSKSREKAKKK